MDASLRVVKGPFSGETILLAPGKLLIGREKDCQLRLDGRSVSHHHCVLLLDDYTLRIRDLGSTNGTLLNGRRLGPRESILADGDTVSIDNLTFRVDLNHVAQGSTITPAEAQSLVSPNALDGTDIFEGDTSLAGLPDADDPSSPERLPQDDPPGTQGETDADAAMNAQKASPAVADKKVAKTKSVSSPSATQRNVSSPANLEKAVASPAQTAAKPNRPAKPAQPAPAKTNGTSKAAKRTGRKGGRVIVGAIVLAGLVGGVAFGVRGLRNSATFEPPQKYVLFSPKSLESILICEVPEDWKQKFSGGRNAGPACARFTGGNLSIEISENLTGNGIREAVSSMRQKGDRERRLGSPAEQIHKFLRQQSSENFKSYNEDPRPRGIKTQGFGEGQISDFTAAEGILSTEIKGCRATVLNQARQFTVICKCPPPVFQKARPVFEKVVASMASRAKP